MNAVRNSIYLMSLKYIVILLFLLLAAFWMLSLIAIPRLQDQIIPLVRGYGDTHTLWAVAFFVGFSVLSVLFGPFTSVFLVPVAIILWGSIVTFFLLVFGWFIGSVAAYAIGLSLGYPLVAKIVSREKLDEWIAFMSREATFFLAFLFRLALPAETGYVFGVVKYPFWKYAAIVIIVEVIVAAVVIGAGDAALENDVVKFIGLVVGVFALFAIAGYLFKRQRRAV